MQKQKFIALAAVMILAFIPLSVAAANRDTEKIDGKTIEQSYTYTTTDKDQKPDFKSTINYGGKTYTLVVPSIKTEIQLESPVTEKKNLTETVTVDHLLVKAIDNTLSKSYGNANFTLELDKADYQEAEIEDGTKVVTATVDYGFNTSQPTPSQTTTISYNSNGRPREATVSFDDFSISSPYWQDGYTITARYVGDEDVRFYNFGGIQIPNTGNGVPYSGYETAILSSLGLDANNVRIDSASWTGSTTENGQHVRYATLNCSRYGRDYVANYSANVPTYVTEYTATAVYKLDNADVPTGDTAYTILASAQYTRSGLSATAIIGISVAFVILVCLIVAVLFRIKKKGEKNNAE